jgi:hypothetical protein
MPLAKIFGKDKGLLEDKKAKLSFEYEHSSKKRNGGQPSSH